MSEATYHNIVLILEIFMSLSIGIICIILGRRNLKKDAENAYNKFKNENFKKVRDDPKKLSEYDAMEERMQAEGIKFRMGNNFTPFDYTVFRIAVCLGVTLLGMLLGPGYMIFGFLLGLVSVPFYFRHKNKFDNDEILSEIGQVYEILGLQMKNGIHISKVIFKCYLNIKQPRLKKALLELSQDIQNFASIEDALESFRKKFTNEHIDALAKTVEQAQDTGNVLQLFADTSENLNIINRAIAKREEGKLEMKGLFFQTLLFLAIMAPVFYAYIVFELGDALNVLSF